MREDWKERANAIGVDFAKIEADRKAGLDRPVDPAIREGKAEEAVRFAIAYLTERESVVDRSEVLSTAVAHAVKEAPWVGVTLDKVNAALNDKIAQKVALTAGDGRITTTEALEREQSMLSMLEGGGNAMRAVMGTDKIDSAIADFEASKSAGLDVAVSCVIWAIPERQPPRPDYEPAILGHEGAGVVVDVGPGVAALKKDDHVIPLARWQPPRRQRRRSRLAHQRTRDDLRFAHHYFSRWGRDSRKSSRSWSHGHTACRRGRQCGPRRWQSGAPHGSLFPRHAPAARHR